MPITLPTKKSPPERIDPAVLIIYGAKKVGKTKLLSELPGCLILDGEKGTEEIEALKLKFSSIYELNEIVSELRKEGQKRVDENKAARAAGKPEPYPGDKVFPYRYLALDTIDAVEAMTIPYETKRYKKTTKGMEFKGEDIMELDYGLGHYFLREGVKRVVLDLAAVCKTLIIISHLEEKVKDKGGMNAVSQEISLSGKLAGIICAMASAIGYITRKPSNKEGVIDPITISFKTTEGITMGARTKHLYGKTFLFDWAKIFTEDPELNPKTPTIAPSTESA